MLWLGKKARPIIAKFATHIVSVLRYTQSGNLNVNETIFWKSLQQKGLIS